MERFSERASRVIEKAEEGARALDHPHVGTEHLLLGLIAVEGPAHDALVAAGATADATRAKVTEAVGRRSSAQPGDPQLSPRARRAIDRAARLSLNRRDPSVDPEHLLIGVLDVEGQAGQVLRGLGVDVAALRVAVDLPIGNVPGAEGLTPPGATATPRPPHCAACSATLDEAGLAYGVFAAEDARGRQRNFAVTSCVACGAVFGTSPV